MNVLYRSMYREILSCIPRAVQFVAMVNTKNTHKGIMVGELTSFEGVRDITMAIIYVPYGYRTKSMSTVVYYLLRKINDIEFINEKFDLYGHTEARMVDDVNGVKYESN